MNMSHSQANIRRACDLLALIVKAPRTRPELAELLQTRSCTLKPWIDALEDEGLIRLESAPKTPGRDGYEAKVVRWIGAPL
jgi:predicted ArsR family transcriptional regulator